MFEIKCRSYIAYDLLQKWFNCGAYYQNLHIVLNEQSLKLIMYKINPDSSEQLIQQIDIKQELIEQFKSEVAILNTVWQQLNKPKTETISDAQVIQELK